MPPKKPAAEAAKAAKPRGPDKSPRMLKGVLPKLSEAELRKYRAERRSAARKAQRLVTSQDRTTPGLLAKAYLNVIRILAPILLKPEGMNSFSTIGEVLESQPDDGKVTWNQDKLVGAGITSQPYDIGARLTVPSRVLAESQDILRKAYQITMPAQYMISPAFRKAMANPFVAAVEGIPLITNAITNPFNALFGKDSGFEVQEREDMLQANYENQARALASQVERYGTSATDARNELQIRKRAMEDDLAGIRQSMDLNVQQLRQRSTTAVAAVVQTVLSAIHSTLTTVPADVAVQLFEILSPYPAFATSPNFAAWNRNFEQGNIVLPVRNVREVVQALKNPPWNAYVNAKDLEEGIITTAKEVNELKEQIRNANNAKASRIQSATTEYQDAIARAERVLEEAERTYAATAEENRRMAGSGFTIARRGGAPPAGGGEAPRRNLAGPSNSTVISDAGMAEAFSAAAGTGLSTADSVLPVGKFPATATAVFLSNDRNPVRALAPPAETISGAGGVTALYTNQKEASAQEHPGAQGEAVGAGMTKVSEQLAAKYPNVNNPGRAPSQFDDIMTLLLEDWPEAKTAAMSRGQPSAVNADLIESALEFASRLQAMLMGRRYTPDIFTAEGRGVIIEAAKVAKYSSADQQAALAALEEIANNAKDSSRQAIAGSRFMAAGRGTRFGDPYAEPAATASESTAAAPVSAATASAASAAPGSRFMAAGMGTRFGDPYAEPAAQAPAAPASEGMGFTERIGRALASAGFMSAFEPDELSEEISAAQAATQEVVNNGAALLDGLAATVASSNTDRSAQGSDNVVNLITLYGESIRLLLNARAPTILQQLGITSTNAGNIVQQLDALNARIAQARNDLAEANANFEQGRTIITQFIRGIKGTVSLAARIISTATSLFYRGVKYVGGGTYRFLAQRWRQPVREAANVTVPQVAAEDNVPVPTADQLFTMEQRLAAAVANSVTANKAALDILAEQASRAQTAIENNNIPEALQILSGIRVKQEESPNAEPLRQLRAAVDRFQGNIASNLGRGIQRQSNRQNAMLALQRLEEDLRPIAATASGGAMRNAATQLLERFMMQVADDFLTPDEYQALNEFVERVRTGAFGYNVTAPLQPRNALPLREVPAGPPEPPGAAVPIRAAAAAGEVEPPAIPEGVGEPVEPAAPPAIPEPEPAAPAVIPEPPPAVAEPVIAEADLMPEMVNFLQTFNRASASFDNQNNGWLTNRVQEPRIDVEDSPLWGQDPATARYQYNLFRERLRTFYAYRALSKGFAKEAMKQSLRDSAQGLASIVRLVSENARSFPNTSRFADKLSALQADMEALANKLQENGVVRLAPRAVADARLGELQPLATRIATAARDILLDPAFQEAQQKGGAFDINERKMIGGGNVMRKAAQIAEEQAEMLSLAAKRLVRAVFEPGFLRRIGTPIAMDAARGIAEGWFPTVWATRLITTLLRQLYTESMRGAQIDRDRNLGQRANFFGELYQPRTIEYLQERVQQMLDDPTHSRLLHNAIAMNTEIYGGPVRDYATGYEVAAGVRDTRDPRVSMSGSGMYGGNRQQTVSKAQYDKLQQRLFALENVDGMNPQARLHLNAAIEAKQRGGAMGDVLYKGLMTKAHELGAHPAVLEKVHSKLHPYEQRGRGLLSGIGKFFGLSKLGGVEHYGSGMYGGSTFDNPYQQGSGGFMSRPQPPPVRLQVNPEFLSPEQHFDDLERGVEDRPFEESPYRGTPGPRSYTQRPPAGHIYRPNQETEQQYIRLYDELMDRKRANEEDPEIPEILRQMKLIHRRYDTEGVRDIDDITMDDLNALYMHATQRHTLSSNRFTRLADGQEGRGIEEAEGVLGDAANFAMDMTPAGVVGNMATGMVDAIMDPEAAISKYKWVGDFGSRIAEAFSGAAPEPNFNGGDTSESGWSDTLEDLIKKRRETSYGRDADLELKFMQAYGDQNLPATTPMPADFPKIAGSWGVDRDLGGMNDFWREQLGRQIKFQTHWPKAYAQLRALKNPGPEIPEETIPAYIGYTADEADAQQLQDLNDIELRRANLQSQANTVNRELMRTIRPITGSVFRRPMGRR